MGFVNFVNNLGSKVSGAAHSLGNKIHQAGSRAGKFIHKVAPKVESIAQTIADDAGIVGDIAEAALPFTAEIPILGEVVGAVAAGGKAVSEVAQGVEYGAELAEAATRGIERVSAGARGDVKDLGRGLLTKAAQRSRDGGALTKDDLKGVAGGVASSAFNRFVGF